MLKVLPTQSGYWIMYIVILISIETPKRGSVHHLMQCFPTWKAPKFFSKKTNNAYYVIYTAINITSYRNSKKMI